MQGWIQAIVVGVLKSLYNLTPGSGSGSALVSGGSLGTPSGGNASAVDIKRVISILISDPGGSAITTGDLKAYYRIPVAMNGYNLTAVAAHVSTVSSSGPVTIQLRNVTDTVDMLSTPITIDQSEKDSSTAAAAVIDTTKDDVATGDEIAIDIDAAGTGAKGLLVEMTFQLP